MTVLGVDDFAVKLFKQWGVGEKKERNGILLLVSIDDRKARIETGYDIEPIIPDLLTVRSTGMSLAGKHVDIVRDHVFGHRSGVGGTSK